MFFYKLIEFVKINIFLIYVLISSNNNINFL